MYMSRLTKQAVSSWDTPIVVTSGGRIRGIEKENGFIFRSIPYGRAKRFEDPEEVTDDGTLFLADHYTCSCPELLTCVPENQHIEPRFFLPQDEDCLNMTVWTPTLSPQKPLPVFVWLGAGDWERGGVNELFASDGENLASYGNVVVVAVNHRLNVLGTMRLEKKSALCSDRESPGVSDLVSALKWVRNNILVFGGDADNVTVFGQAGGGQKILDLMRVSAADGLYHKAVISGMELSEKVPETERRRLTDFILKQMKEEDPRTMPYWFLAEHVLDALEEYKKVTGRKYVWKAAELAEKEPTQWAKKVPMLVSTAGEPSGQVKEFVRREKEAGRNIWHYEFAFASPLYGAEQTWNGAELPFWFHNADYLESSYVPGVTEKLQDRMAKALAGFAKDGWFQMEEET